MKLVLDITQEFINIGEKAKASQCAGAKCANQYLKPEYFSIVTVADAKCLDTIIPMGLSIYTRDLTKSERHHIPSKELSSFAIDFDYGCAIPTKIEIDIPSKYVKSEYLNLPEMPELNIESECLC